MSIAPRRVAAGLFAMSILALSMPDIATAADRRVRIINASNVTLSRFFASNAGRRTWEEDILGNSVLPAGHSVTINIDDGSGACMFDFKAVLSNGRTIESYGMNVCQITSWTVR